MTLHTPANRIEPHERPHPENELLDAIEADIRAAIAAGARPQIIARLQRLIPEIVREPAPAPLLPDPMTISTVLTTCRHLSTFRLQAGQHEAIARLRNWCLQTLSTLGSIEGRRQ